MTLDFVVIGTVIATIIVAILRASAPIILAAMGGLISELAGAVNVALEGIMLIGAFFGVVVSAYAPAWFPDAPAWIYPWLGCLAGLVAAIALVGVLAVFHLEFGADLIVAGIGINILAAGLTVFLLVHVAGDKGSTANLASYALPSIRIPFADEVPILRVLLNGEALAGHHILIFGAFLSVAVVSVLLFRTVFGAHLRAVGENAEAALAAGIPVKRIQYLAMLASGFLAGLGGVYLSMGYLTLFQADMSAGRGFLALAAIFLGGRRPLGTLAASVLFGASSVLAAQLGVLAIPSQIVFMIPPLITIAAMVFFNYRSELANKAKVRNAARKISADLAKKQILLGATK